jgi:hypothetical protein
MGAVWRRNRRQGERESGALHSAVQPQGRPRHVYGPHAHSAPRDTGAAVRGYLSPRKRFSAGIRDSTKGITFFWFPMMWILVPGAFGSLFRKEK